MIKPLEYNEELGDALSHCRAASKLMASVQKEVRASPPLLPPAKHGGTGTGLAFSQRSSLANGD